MHILMIAPERLPVPGNGSVEICMLSIAKKLALNHQVTIVSRQHHKYSRQIQFGKIKIVRVPSPNKSSYIKNVLRYMRNKHFDLIQVDNRPHYMANIKQAFPQTPVSLFLHSLTFVPRTIKMSSSLEKADLIVVNSASLHQNVSKQFPKCRYKIKTVHLGVNTSKFRPLTEAQRKKQKQKLQIGDSYSILYAGRIVPRKGIPVLIKAISLTHGKARIAKLVIVGSGKISYIRKLKSLSRMLKVPITWVGEVSHDRMQSYYQTADCFVCPSQRHESFGLVNVEAMSSGVPVVASEIGGIKEIVDHGKNGYLVTDYRNPARFAHYISQLINDKKRARAMTLNARETALRRFDWSQTARKLAREYTEFINNHLPSKRFHNMMDQS